MKVSTVKSITRQIGLIYGSSMKQGLKQRLPRNLITIKTKKLTCITDI